MNFQVIIIGGGPAGISALLWCHSLGLSAIILERAPELGGQMLQMFHPVLEYPGFPNKTGHALRDDFVAHLQAYNLQWRLQAHLDEINLQDHQLIIDGEQLTYDALIIATGASNRRLGLPEEEKLIGNGISDSATRDKNLFTGKNVCVTGGGDSAFEDCLILAEVCPQVTLLHRSENFRARESWQRDVFNHPRINILTNREIKSINQQGDKQLELTIANRISGEQQQLLVSGLFVRLGIQPNTNFLRGQLALDEAGYIITDRAQQTSQANIYAIGDVCRPVCLSVATAVGHGAIAAKHLAEKIRSERLT